MKERRRKGGKTKWPKKNKIKTEGKIWYNIKMSKVKNKTEVKELQRQQGKQAQ